MSKKNSRPPAPTAGRRRAEPSVSRVRYSIVRKLSSRLFFRLFAIFLTFDIIICLIAGVTLTVYCEDQVSDAVMLMGQTPGESPGLPNLPGVTIETVDAANPADGFQVISPFSSLLPDHTREAERSIRMGDSAGGSLYEKLGGLTYHVYVETLWTIYNISVDIGSFLYYFAIAFSVLLVIELFSLLTNTAKNARLVRRTLDPITELTRAAQNLNAVSSQLDPNKMAALAGKLEGINAARLDTRIQVDETQEELKNLARAINGMLDRINESYRAQVRFVSDASHELRTPISVIQGYANLLDRWGKNDEKTLQESIAAIKDEAANMKDLVEQLLFLARGDNNTIMLQAEPFNLSELANEVIHEMTLIDSTHNFTPKLKDVTVTADKGLIKQALRILVDNAIKYTDPGGNIALITESADGYAKLSVRDDGIGISPEIVPRIFDRFYRADESRARATGGAGLGLSIAKWITSRHGGHMEVLSREGVGTKISLVLPAEPNQPATVTGHTE
jgi:two-component system sensor histidine kinase ArlS